MRTENEPSQGHRCVPSQGHRCISSQGHRCVSSSVLLSEGKVDQLPLPPTSDFYITLGLKPSWICRLCHVPVVYFPHIKSETHSVHCVCSMALSLPHAQSSWLSLYTHHQYSKVLQLLPSGWTLSHPSPHIPKELWMYSISASSSNQPRTPPSLLWVFCG